jgi:transposase
LQGEGDVGRDEGGQLEDAALPHAGHGARVSLLGSPSATSAWAASTTGTLAGYDLSTDRLYGHVKTRKGRGEFLGFARYLRTLHPPGVRIAIVLDNFSPHLSTKTDDRVGRWAAANNVELAYVPFYASWLNQISVNRGPVHRPALLRPRRHRPPQPRRAGQHDPPLHRLAEPPPQRPPAPQDRPARRSHQEGEGCLMRH